MAGDDSLFSLEVYVEIVENICVTCYKPAVAFRFLDFPTVLMRTEREEFCSNEKSLQIQSGKSCLFKMSKEVLGERLRNTPLYVMFIDISSGTTKLLASSTISMVNCFENILANIEENGFDIPAIAGRKGEFQLYNLMGSHVGTVKLRYRMFSFGLGMSGHVNLSLSKKRASKKNIQTDSLPEQHGEKDTHIDEVCYRTECSTTENKMSVVSDLEKENHALRTDVATQTENADTKQLNAASCQKYNNPEPLSVRPHDNISRPPPLYYNSISTFTKARATSGHSVRSLKEDVTSKLQYCDTSMQTCMPYTCSNNVSPNVPMQQEDASTQCPSNSQYDLPLIEALLNELSLVRTQYVNNGELSQQFYKSAKSPGKNKQVKIGNTADVSSKRLQIQKNKVEKVQLDPRKNCSKSKPTRAGSKGVLISRHPVKFKKSSLTYGTTKTQKLREAMSKKGIHGEQSIQPPRSQVEPSLSEDKHEHSNVMQNDRMVVQKSSQTLKENTSTMTQNGKTHLECKDEGVQVKINGDDFPAKGPVQKQQVQESLLGCNVILEKYRQQIQNNGTPGMKHRE